MIYLFKKKSEWWKHRVQCFQMVPFRSEEGIRYAGKKNQCDFPLMGETSKNTVTVHHVLQTPNHHAPRVLLQLRLTAVPPTWQLVSGRSSFLPNSPV